MAQQIDAYPIRRALALDIPRLREIEDAAGTLFSGLRLIDEALDASFPLEKLSELVARGQVWVVCATGDLPVGMVIASLEDSAVYLEEIDVLPTYGRRGLGARLLESVCTWARAQGHSAVTLSTFREVPWNGPFYRKHGFRDLEPKEWTPRMHAIREQEALHGLRIEARTFMRRDLRGTTLPSIELRTRDCAEIESFLADRIEEFNSKATGYNDGESFAATHTDEAGAILGGIAGHTWGGVCFVAYLWVAEEYRSQGLGGALLRVAEQNAADKGCALVLLSSHSFQSPGFYARWGYEQQATINDHP
ncbi:MAG: GNAT family N-acetyltransferase, partial [Polyangiaceae bacterium]